MFNNRQLRLFNRPQRKELFARWVEWVPVAYIRECKLTLANSTFDLLTYMNADLGLIGRLNLHDSLSGQVKVEEVPSEYVELPMMGFNYRKQERITP